MIESSQADANVVKQFGEDHQIQENYSNQEIQSTPVNQKIFSDYQIGSSGQAEQNSAHFFNESSFIQIQKIDLENIYSSKGENVQFQMNKEFVFLKENKSKILIPQNLQEQSDAQNNQNLQVQIQANVNNDSANKFYNDQKLPQNIEQEEKQKTNFKIQHDQIPFQDNKKQPSMGIIQKRSNQNDSQISLEAQVIFQSIEDQFNRNKLDKDQFPSSDKLKFDNPSSVESKSYGIVRSQNQNYSHSPETILEQNIQMKIQCKTVGNHLRSKKIPMIAGTENIKREIFPKSVNFVEAQSQILYPITYFSASSSNITDEINQANKQLANNLRQKMIFLNQDQVNLRNLNNIREGSNLDASLEPVSSNSQQMMYLTSITHQMIKIVKQLIANDKQQDQAQLGDLLSLAKTAEKLSRKISSQNLTFSNSIQPNNREEIQILQDQNEFLRQENKILNNKLKSQEIFISMIIHDLRNPTNAVIAMSDQISIELEDELFKSKKLKEIFTNMELEAVSVIQKAIDLSSLSQLSLMSDNFKGLLANPDTLFSYPSQRNITFFNSEVKPGDFSVKANLEGDHFSQSNSDQFLNSVKIFQLQSNKSESSGQSSNQLGVKRIVKSPIPRITNFSQGKLSQNNLEPNSRYSQFDPIKEQDELQEKSIDFSLDKNINQNKPEIKPMVKIEEELKSQSSIPPPSQSAKEESIDVAMNSQINQSVQNSYNNFVRLPYENLQIPTVRSSFSMNSFV